MHRRMHKTNAERAKTIPYHGRPSGSADSNNAVLRPNLSTNQTARKLPGNEPKRKLEATHEPSSYYMVKYF